MYRTINDTMAEAISASIQGAAHCRENKTCQDAVSIKEGTFHGKPYLICSVADGHGDDYYHFSHAGSLFAALAAEKTLTQFFMRGVTISDNRGEYFTSYITTNLKQEWEDNIRQSWDQFRIGHDLIKRHGTTLLTVLFYDGYAFMAQLGDGDICYMDRVGNPVFLVKPADGPSDSTTDSLCSRSADECWNFACVPEKDIAFLTMSTDGLINSMASCEEYIKLAKTLRGYIGEFRPAQIDALLPEWLADYSETGCGDDISLVAVNLTPNNNQSGEEDNEHTENTRIENKKQTGGRRTGSRLCRRKRRAAFRLQALQRCQRHPRSAGYYLLSGRGRRSRRRMR